MSYFTRFQKANPYRDENGLFSSKDSSAMTVGSGNGGDGAKPTTREGLEKYKQTMHQTMLAAAAKPRTPETEAEFNLASRGWNFAHDKLKTLKD